MDHDGMAFYTVGKTWQIRGQGACMMSTLRNVLGTAASCGASNVRWRKEAPQWGGRTHGVSPVIRWSLQKYLRRAKNLNRRLSHSIVAGSCRLGATKGRWGADPTWPSCAQRTSRRQHVQLFLLRHTLVSAHTSTCLGAMRRNPVLGDTLSRTRPVPPCTTLQEYRPACARSRDPLRSASVQPHLQSTPTRN